VEAGVLLARVELEPIRRSPRAALDEPGDLTASIGGADVVPSLSLGPQRHPVALAIGADP
jgi:hypothetical protein